MQLVLHYKAPELEVLQCDHCDEIIEQKEVYKYVKFVIGVKRINFHEECFEMIRHAINQFSDAFLEKPITHTRIH